MDEVFTYRPPPILVYHEWNRDLEGQLAVIRQRGFEAVHLADIGLYLRNPATQPFPEGKVVLTFDDAYLDFYTHVRPMLARFGFTATVCVPTGWVSDDRETRRFSGWDKSSGQYPMMDWGELRELRGEGFDLIPHSVSHKPFRHSEIEAIPDRLRYEVGESRRTMLAKLGVQQVPAFFCLPYGDGWKCRSDDLVNSLLIEEGYVGALRAEYGGEGWNQWCIPRWDWPSFARTFLT